MLILTRRPGESIMIENNDTVAEEDPNSESESIKVGIGQALITITILRVKGGQVSLGIDAPSSISILREEIYHKSKQDADRSKREYADDYESDYSEDEYSQ